MKSKATMDTENGGVEFIHESKNSMTIEIDIEEENS